MVFGYYVRLFNQGDGPTADLPALVTHLRNNAPDCLPVGGVTANEKKRTFQRWGLEKPEGTAFAELGLVKVPPVLSEHFSIFGRKLLCAIHYRELGLPLGADNSVMISWSQLQIPTTLKTIESMRSVLPNLTIGDRRNTSLGEQFSYRWGANAAERLFGAMIQFGRSIFLLGAAAPNEVAAGTDDPSAWKRHDGPWAHK